MPFVHTEPVQRFGVILPVKLVAQVDKIRGDVNRSRYIQRLIEKYAISQIDVKVGAPNQSVIPRTKAGGINSRNG